MRADEYALMEKAQETHWLWAGRREILRQILEYHLPKRPEMNIADVGCGFGANLPLLMNYGKVTGLEPHKDAVNHLQNLFGNEADIRQWRLPENPGRTFDLAVLADVLEHFENDKLAMTWLENYLNPGGFAIITAPAHSWLWSDMDEVVQHYRRYTQQSLKKIVPKSFAVDFFSYYNYYLFPAKLGLLCLYKIKHLLFPNAVRQSHNETPPELLNNLAKSVIFKEAARIGRKKGFPFGCSLVMLMKKLPDERKDWLKHEPGL